MEHEIDKRIREKVAEADHLVVTWRKEQVWGQIAFPASRKPRWTVYYAAASVVIVALILSKLEQALTESRIKTLEAVIENQLAQEKMVLQPEIRCAQNQPAAPTRVRIGTRTKVNLKLTQQTAPAENKHEIEIEPTTQVALNDPPLVEATEKPVITAIVGVIPSQKQVQVKSRNKKVRIRIFKPEQDLFPNPMEDSRILTARIN